MKSAVAKGISPLIAAVLLIAVTMTIAGVLAYWASTFVRGQTEVFSNQTVATECQFGRFVIEACSYNSAGQSVTFIIDNIGTIDLNNVSVFAVYPDNTVNSTQLAQGIASGQLKSFTAGGIANGFSAIRVRTHCPNVFEETTCR